MKDSTEIRRRSNIEIEQQLRQMNDEWVKALVRRDPDTLNRIMAEDFFFTYPLEGDDKAQFVNDVVSGDLLVGWPGTGSLVPYILLGAGVVHTPAAPGTGIAAATDFLGRVGTGLNVLTRLGTWFIEMSLGAYDFSGLGANSFQLDWSGHVGVAVAIPF